MGARELWLLLVLALDDALAGSCPPTSGRISVHLERDQTDLVVAVPPDTDFAAVTLTADADIVIFLCVCYARAARRSKILCALANARNFAVLEANARNLAAGANARNFRALQIHTTYPWIPLAS